MYSWTDRQFNSLDSSEDVILASSVPHGENPILARPLLNSLRYPGGFLRVGHFSSETLIKYAEEDANTTH